MKQSCLWCWEKIVDQFKVLGGSSEHEEEIWVEKILLLFCFSKKKYTKSVGLVSVHQIKIALPLKTVNEVLRLVCMR